MFTLMATTPKGSEMVIFHFETAQEAEMEKEFKEKMYSQWDFYIVETEEIDG